MIESITEITSTGYKLEEGEKNLLLANLSFQERLDKNREIGKTIQLKWTSENLERSISFSQPIDSFCLSDSRGYIAVSLESGIFLYSRSGELIDSISYPFTFGKIDIKKGKIRLKKANESFLKFKVITDEHDFFTIYSLSDKVIRSIEWMR
ncbi:hypothetical protein [Marinomonas aquiplantarum]|uniref:Uncharacterized protein n=1 Tax=Marinomonas aquiplantarum TaxID=491951 RepID=A0A366CZP7_9GAMM|nr:hypothetical protein [Marinomonas aquiplantarum]RBO83300.1 hypothetical protein DFP76_104115 [Marinomonas aquiplantarum]